MGKNKRSFFERLTGTVSLEDYDNDFFDDDRETLEKSTASPAKKILEDEGEERVIHEPEEGQLSVDVYQSPTHITIKAHVAGVRPEDIDVSITRDMVTIKGRREEAREVEEDDYFFKELYWGAFSRTILLPAEVEIEGAEATQRQGLLTLRLPKIDKERQTKLKVKAH